MTTLLVVVVVIAISAFIVHVRTTRVVRVAAINASSPAYRWLVRRRTAISVSVSVLINLVGKIAPFSGAPFCGRLLAEGFTAAYPTTITILTSGGSGGRNSVVVLALGGDDLCGAVFSVRTVPRDVLDDAVHVDGH